MIDPGLTDFQSRLYEAYASQCAGHGGGEAAALVYRRDIRPLLLPPAAGPAIDLGCRQGELVRLLHADGFDAEGIDISPEQVALTQAAGVTRVRQEDFPVVLWQFVSACYRIALAAETGVLRGHVVAQNLTSAARKGTLTVQPVDR